MALAPRLAHRNEQHEIEREVRARLLGQEQVPEMHRIERAAEDAYSHSNESAERRAIRSAGEEARRRAKTERRSAGGTEGVKIFNAGMRGTKGTAYQGGTRTPAFFRWPAGGIKGGEECNALSAHLDLFPTLSEITGAKISDETQKQVEGSSLFSLLKNPKADWPDRTLVHHVGRWEKGKAEQSKYSKCAIQNSRFTLVNNAELYDLKADPDETHNVIAEHPEVVASLQAAYDTWWSETLPLLVNENAVGPNVNPMKELYWKQFGIEPDEKTLRKMNPEKKSK